MDDIAKHAIDALFASVPVAVQIYWLEQADDPRSLRLVAANPLAATVSSAEPGTRIDECFASLGGQDVAGLFAGVVRSGEAATVEDISLGEGEDERIYSLKAFPLLGSCVGVMFNDITLRKRAEAQAVQSREFYRLILDAIPYMLFVKDAKDLRYVEWNTTTTKITGMNREEALGLDDFKIFPPYAELIQQMDRQIIAEKEIHYIPDESINTKHQGIRSFRTHKVPIFDEKGEPLYLLGISEDNTEQKAANDALRHSESELRRVQERLLETIQELSTPILPIHDGVLVIPLIGQMDTSRSAQFMDTLLERVHSHHTHTVIIDVTGLPVVDTAVANCLMQAARAAMLLGVHCVIVGIAPQVASTIIQIGIDLSSIVTKRDLQAGVAYALARQRT